MNEPIGLLHPKALPPFAALRAFEAFGRVGSIRKAAASLNLDHAVVSRHVRSLEEWLGVILVERAGGRLSLTETGAAYHARISHALVEIASATSSVTASPHQREARLWCIPGFAAQWLSERLAAFERSHPQFLIELRPTDRCADLLMHEADIDVRYYGDEWPPSPGGKSLRAVELARPPVMAVASPALAAELNAAPDPRALLDASLLHEEHDEQWRAWLRLNGIACPDRLPGALLWHAHMAIGAARQGRGVALANPYLVAQDLAEGNLVEVAPAGTRPVILGGYYFVTREDRWTLPVIATLRHFLLQEARRVPGVD